MLVRESVLCAQACPCTCFVLRVPHRSVVNSSNVSTVCKGFAVMHIICKSITVSVLLWLSLCLCFCCLAFRTPASDGSFPCQPPCSSLIMLTASSQIKAVTTAAGQSRLVQFISRYVKWIHGERPAHHSLSCETCQVAKWWVCGWTRG